MSKYKSLVVGKKYILDAEEFHRINTEFYKAEFGVQEIEESLLESAKSFGIQEMNFLKNGILECIKFDEHIYDELICSIKFKGQVYTWCYRKETVKCFKEVREFTQEEFDI